MRITAAKLHEECAVFGTSVTTDEATGFTYNGLLALQHRGQEGSGIAVLNGHNITVRKKRGLVSEVFSELNKLPQGKTAVGHNRYSTTGNNTANNLQPFVTEYLTGRIATAHNGNVINAKELRTHLVDCGINFIASSDTEIISSLIAHSILREQDDIKGIISAVRQLKGAFSLIIMTGGGKLIALRDPRGFRPLCIGKNSAGVAFASESCALDSTGFEFIRDIKPGELVAAEHGKITQSVQYADVSGTGLCIFEYVYFSRPDSVIDGLSVYEARHNMGKALARSHPVMADGVCGVPDSGLEAAMGYAEESGLPLISGFVKNRYIGRSFIFPSQTQREDAVKMKLNPLRASVRNKSIVLVDDSIVRGTTCAKIITALRHAGAREIHMRISSPPFRHTCHFGTDIGSEENLIANSLEIEQIRQKIGADTLGYIDIEELKNSCRDCDLGFCTGCFNGDYGIDAGTADKNILE